MGRLVVVSNRIAPPDDKKASAGGLAVGVLGALKAAGGLWFGWSGDISEEEKPLKKGFRWISIDGLYIFFTMYNHLFQQIQWEDEEPKLISDLIK